jgi:hypothetical protein
VLSADDPVWEESDRKPVDGVRVTGRISSAGQGRFYWHAHLRGDVVLECSRCLAEAEAHVDEEAHIIFAEQGGEDADEPDVYVYERTAVTSTFARAARVAARGTGVARSVARLQGLCPAAGPISTRAARMRDADGRPRWDALKKLNVSS